jgi:DNA-binding transcriptional ArsR family regulator
MFNREPIDTWVVGQLAEMFRLLGDQSRLRIVLAIAGQERAVGDIASVTGLSPSLVSHHLRLLRATRLVKPRRHGRQVFYGAMDQHINRAVTDMLDHVREIRPGNATS